MFQILFRSVSLSSVPVPQHSASAQDPLRHHGYSRCSAPLQQAQVLECVGAQRRGGILQNWLIPDSTGIINGLLFRLLLFCMQILDKLLTRSFPSISAWLSLQSTAPSFSSFSPSSSIIHEPSLLLSASPDLLPLALSVSLSLSYSCCHPHRTSQKCADSGCWATLPYY